METNLVTSDALVALAGGLIQTARDAAFNAVCAAALARLATHQGWGGGVERKMADVDAEFADLFNAQNKKSNAYRWIALSKKLSVKANKDLAGTLKTCATAADAETAFSVFVGAVKCEALTLDELESWVEGKAKAATDTVRLADKIKKALAKGMLDMTDGEIMEIEALFSAERSRRANVIGQALKAEARAA